MSGLLPASTVLVRCSFHLRILQMQPSKRVLLPLRQHVGKPAEATVKPGDRVRRGDVVGEIPEKALGARIHASIDGVVSAVDARGVEITGGESA